MPRRFSAWVLVFSLFFVFPLEAQDIYLFPYKKISVGSKEVTAIAFSQTSDKVVVQSSGQLVVVSVENSQTIKSIPQKAPVVLMDFIENGEKFLVVDELGKSSTYATSDFSVAGSSQLDKAIQTACLDPTLQYVTWVNKANEVQFFDLRSGMTQGKVQANPELKNTRYVGYDRFAQQVAAITELGDAFAWNPLNQKFLRQLKLQSGEFANSRTIIHSAAANSGADRFLIGMQEVFLPKGGQQKGNMMERRNMIVVYDWTSGEEVKRVPLRYRVDGMAMGPGPNHVSFFSTDSKTINLLNLERSEVGSSVVVDTKPSSILLSDDGQLLAVGTVSGEVYLYEVVRNDPPEIKIVKPALSRNYGEQTVRETKLRVEGMIDGTDKIAKVFVNGEPATFDYGKQFSYDVNLAKGKNRITVAIQNTQSVTTEKDFYVNCEPATNTKSTAEKLPGKRMALVIGNASYSSAAKLNNTKNDANAIAAALTELGFDVMKVLDGSYEQMKNAVYTFGDKVQTADICVFYYAGHGLEIDGSNYLVPVDADIQSALDVKQKAIPLAAVSKTMEFANDEGLNMIILDACRNNPFPTGKRSSGSGLARVEVPSGTLIAYATDPGSVASDGNGTNGLYTGELVKQLRVSQRIEDVFMNTRNSVEKLSNGTQRPWEEQRLKGIFYLK